MTCSKGLQARAQIPGHHCEDKASEHGMPTLATELGDAPEMYVLQPLLSKGKLMGKRFFGPLWVM